MNRVMLAGETGVGKSALVRAFSGGAYVKTRPMSVEYFGQFIITPGEFLENRRFYRALITASADCNLLVMMQDATRDTSLFPPQFATAFNRQVVGVITRIDAPNARPDRAERFLHNAGVHTLFLLSLQTGQGLEALRALFAGNDFPQAAPAGG